MSGHLHRIARWLRLGLTSLALALGAVPAHALPAARAEVTLSVERRDSPKQREAAQAAVHVPAAVGSFLQVHARAESPRLAPETRPPGPPRRLFIAHRALLH
ncbi:hypothetical protein [Hyalangium versicolor]|uniref:hypothetical protein n=1 Tax=Hyalangium versicolor TaxID=2861190 RepID=UPI001CC97AC6|nr:hypothetical protein [Hyalangium versicolor]